MLTEREQVIIRASLADDNPAREGGGCASIVGMIVDGSYWVGRRAHHFDQRCS